jgi:hypothetical protein
MIMPDHGWRCSCGATSPPGMAWVASPVGRTNRWHHFERWHAIRARVRDEGVHRMVPVEMPGDNPAPSGLDVVTLDEFYTALLTVAVKGAREVRLVVTDNGLRVSVDQCIWSPPIGIVEKAL